MVRSQLTKHIHSEKDRIRQEEKQADASHACDERGHEHDGDADSDGRSRHHIVVLLLDPCVESGEVSRSNHGDGHEIREHEQQEEPVVELGCRGKAVRRPFERRRLGRPGQGNHDGERPY